MSSLLVSFEAKFQKLIKDVKDYIKSLVEIMQTAEDLESLENLHALCSLMQTIRALFIFSFPYLPLITHLLVMLNDHTMYEHILEDDIFFGVVGMLECTTFPLTPK